MLVWREIGLYVFHLDFEFYAKYKCRHLMIFKAKLNAQIFCAVIKHLINHTATIHFGYSMLRYKNYDSYQTLRPVFHFNWIENRWALSRQTPSLSLVCNDLKNAYCTPFQYLLTFSIRHEYTITISSSPHFCKRESIPKFIQCKRAKSQDLDHKPANVADHLRLIAAAGGA